MRQRWQAKLREVKTALRQRLHDPVPEVGAYLRASSGGHALLRRALEHCCAARLRWAVGRQVSVLRGAVAHPPWTAWPVSSLSGFRPRWYVIIRTVGALASLPRQTGCGNAARPDLWRGDGRLSFLLRLQSRNARACIDGALCRGQCTSVCRNLRPMRTTRYRTCVPGGCAAPLSSRRCVSPARRHV